MRPSLQRLRLFAGFVIALSLALGYFVLVRPLLEAQRTGVLQFSIKAVLVPVAFLYMGFALLVTDLRDGTLRTVGPDGKSRFTRKGRIFVIGLIAVLATAVGIWYGLLHVLGFREPA